MNLLTNEQQESYENAKIRYICKEKLTYITFSDPIEIIKTILYKLQFIDSARFMPSHYQILLIILL